ncbi:SDR family NAD(P)-dependent oxidoreductase [Siphonobacter sp. SORGH_AS_0500]|uniref:SDR family NAD(P)-dependent oxidoreductase n=1 Tax=Siphonobacter sp. SORGH_AS_0500 TaxID=1864824 RepID=UPI00285B7684|nr:SDR family NAD(P)-dependent oxidoreductase [Siphonobacter sp. SORGH_AS_0500]MDR6193762.1 NAD(P)-dependent dehydrogenase (short-subunit alcohol dehydrogenase family) [Siphonobacter sp. SORGH_AS_0500]
MKKVWFITGASKGLGLALVKKLLAEGHSVAATSRSFDSLVQAVGASSSSFLPLQVDLTSESSVQQAITQTHQTFGKLDVILNNAGYGIGGSIEELSDAETRTSFDVNVFATLNVIRKAMPLLREQRSGHIINIASIAGFSANTGWAIYAASKFAVVGFSEVLAEDVRELGIKVTVLEPGAFRTSFLTEESLVFAQEQIADYQSIRDSHDKYRHMNGTQIGDPDRAAEVILSLTTMENPPVRLFMGSDAYKRATQKVNLLQRELEEFKAISYSTDFQ